MMMVNPLNQELFDLAATEMTYYKLFDYILTDFVSRDDLRDMLIPQNMLVQVVVPAGTGGVTKAIVDPSLGATPSALGLKAAVSVKKALMQLEPSKFLE